MPTGCFRKVSSVSGGEGGAAPRLFSLVACHDIVQMSTCSKEQERNSERFGFLLIGFDICFEVFSSL